MFNGHRHALHVCKYTIAGCFGLFTLENRLLQLCAAWRSIQHHSEAPASPEQRGAYRSRSASTVRRQLAASDAALAAR